MAIKQKPLDYNWANDKEFALTVKNNLLSIFQNVQSSRKNRELSWQDHYRAWSVDKTESDKSYNGMANLSVPQIRKEVETMTRRLYKGLLPDDYLKAEPKEMMYEDLTTINTQVVRHYFDNVIRVKSVFMPFLKQGVLLGSSPLRSFWHKETNEMIYRKREPKVKPDGTIEFSSRQVQEEVVLYNAPKLRTEDLFNTWVYPYNAQRPEDIEITFWRTKLTKHDLELKAKSGHCVGFEDFKDMGATFEAAFIESQERLQQFGETGQFLAVQDNNIFELMEVWCKLVLPNTTQPVSCVIEIVGGNFCTRIQRNPYWHQQMPFDWMRYIIPPAGEFYGRGLPEAGISLQNQLNDTMNQTMDSVTLRLNNITIINPAYAPNSESFEIEPGATWWADPNAVKQMEFPDLSQSGYMAASTLRGMITEMSDNSPQLPDPIAGKARSTGQAQLAINEWQTDLFTFIDYVSEEALSPLAFKVHLLLQQFLSDDDVIRVSGKYSGTWLERVVSADDLVGQYMFKWIGALQIENSAVKTQQMMNLLKILPSLPPQAQQDVKLNWANFVTKIMRDGFLIKDLENIMETANLTASVSPKIEEKILKLNGVIKVNASDDDMLHLQLHEYEQRIDKDLYRSAVRSKHIVEHKDQLQKKQIVLKMMQQQQQQIQAPQQKPVGNTTQIQQTPTQDNMERGMRP